MRHRAIYLLPNLFTSAALFAGFYSIIAGFQGHFITAAIAIFVAGVLDGIDGRVARLTHTQSEFGVQYDSLSDLVSFGMAPALLAFSWSLHTMHNYGPTWGKVGWLAAFVYLACAALRLARFNTQTGVADKRWFVGLASPAAAGTLAAYIWCFEDLSARTGWSGADLAPVTAVLTVSLGLLMFTTTRYFSFKQLPAQDHDRVSLRWIFLALLVFVALAIDPPRVLLALSLTYVLSGPIGMLWRRQRAAFAKRDRSNRQPDPTGPSGPPEP